MLFSFSACGNDWDLTHTLLTTKFICLRLDSCSRFSQDSVLKIKSMYDFNIQTPEDSSGADSGNGMCMNVDVSWFLKSLNKTYMCNKSLIYVLRFSYYSIPFLLIDSGGAD